MINKNEDEEVEYVFNPPSEENESVSSFGEMTRKIKFEVPEDYPAPDTPVQVEYYCKKTGNWKKMTKKMMKEK